MLNIKCKKYIGICIAEHSTYNNFITILIEQIANTTTCRTTYAYIDLMAKVTECYEAQVLCSSMVFHEDVDIETLTLGVLHKKSHYVQIRVEELVQSLQHVRSTQLRLFNIALGVEDATDDIVPILYCTRALLGEKVVQPKEKSSKTTLEFVGEVHEAVSLVGLDSMPMHCDFNGVDCISTRDLSLTQFSSELQNTPLRFVCRPTPLSAYEILCTYVFC